MDEREALIAKVTEEATKKAKTDKLNAAQTKLYIEEAVKKAVEEYDEKIEKTSVTPTQTIPTASTVDNKEAEGNKDIKNKEVKNTTKKKYIVHTPVVNFCGEVAGVQFAYGKAEVKPGWVLNWFKEHGYKVEEVSE